MPELRECVAAALQITHFQRSQPREALHLENLVADATESERAQYQAQFPHSPWSKGFCPTINPAVPFKRGSKPKDSKDKAK